MISNNRRGFTLIEILMILLLVAILTAVAINAFVNFRNEAKDAALRENLAAFRAAITAQYGQVQLRCNGLASQWPTAALITANNIVDGVICTAAELTNTAENRFFSGPRPANPWAVTASDARLVTACTTDCTPGDAAKCAALVDGNGWCYNPANGQVWPDMATIDSTKELF